MLKDFSKINTFLTVVREKSFSKASKKLGISQPAVTQQIKLLESYIKHPIVDRKKNGIGLTKEGKEFHRIAQKLDRFLGNLEREALQVISKKITFSIGASRTIGKYILPNFLSEIKEAIENNISIKLGSADDIVKDLLDRKIDLALVEETNFNNAIMFREWMDDDLVLFSNEPLPPYLSKDQLKNYRWISRSPDSHLHQAIIEKFENANIDYSNFDLVSFVSSSTAIKQTILKAKPHKEGEKQIIAFISKHAVKDEAEAKQVYVSRVRGIKFHQKLYLAYLKELKNDVFVMRATGYIMSKRKV